MVAQPARQHRISAVIDLRRHWPLLASALLCLAPLALTGCESNPEPDPTVVKLNDIDERLGRVEKVVNNQSLLQLSQRIDELETQLREMRGSLEELQNNDETLRKQQRDLYADLDRRLTALQNSAAAVGANVGPAGNAGSASIGSEPGGEQAAYQKGLDALKNNDLNGAINRFKDFLRNYPQSSLDGNAQYWLGEAYYVMRDLDSAAVAFGAVGTQYPKSPKVPDALYKLGVTQVDQKHLTDARATLNQVVQRFPSSDAAKLATSKLQNLPPDAR
jgi:tol-pal system protein YbgF